VDDTYVQITTPFAISLYGTQHQHHRFKVMDVFVLVVVIVRIRIQLYLRRVFLVQQHLDIGMIYIFIVEPHKQFIMEQRAHIQIVR